MSIIIEAYINALSYATWQYFLLNFSKNNFPRHDSRKKGNQKNLHDIHHLWHNNLGLEIKIRTLVTETLKGNQLGN